MAKGTILRQDTADYIFMRSGLLFWNHRNLHPPNRQS